MQPPRDFQLVTSTAELERCVAACMSCQAVAVDTEFIRRRTFYAVPALIQLSDGKRQWLIDLLHFDNLEPLAALMENTSVLKVFHACKEDLLVLKRLCGTFPSSLFDTQIALSLCRLDAFQISYRDAVQICLDVDLVNDETLSDWLHRPLTTAQLEYAADDVRWLLPLYDILRQRLDEMNRRQWEREDTVRLVEAVKRELEPDPVYLLSQVKGHGQLSPRAYLLLLRLCSWRDRYARRVDRPRRWIMSDKNLLRIVRGEPGSAQELQSLLGWKRLSRVLKSLADELQQMCHELDRKKLPVNPPPQLADKELVMELRSAVQDHACNNLGIPPQMLMTKGECVAIVGNRQFGGKLPERLMSGWRSEQLEHFNTLLERCAVSR